MPGDPPKEMTDEDGWGDPADAPEPEPKAEPNGPEEAEAAPAPEAPEPSPDAGFTGTVAEAAGIAPPPQPRRPRLSRRARFFALAAIALLCFIGAGGVLSYLNSRQLYLVCGDQDVRAERGSFFPWGRTAMEGERWKPFKLPGACESRELDSELELETAMLELLVARASALLAAEAPELEEGEELIEQGLALARAPEHKASRTELERLRGDIEYWRGRADITAAVERLRSARAHLDEAIKIGPRHANDADKWLPFIDRLVERAGSGPGAPIEADTGPIDLVESPSDGAPLATPVLIPDAGPATAPARDAGVPAGGVLL